MSVQHRWWSTGLVALVLVFAIVGACWRFGTPGTRPTGTAAHPRSFRPGPHSTSELLASDEAWVTRQEQIAGDVGDAAGPLASASVELSRGVLGTAPIVVRTVRTDAAGRFDLGAHPPGRYAITARALGHTPTVLAADLRVPAEAAKWRHAHLELPACSAEATFSVVGNDAAPVAGAVIVIADPGGAQTALGTTGADGMLVACAPVGTWTLAVQAPGYATTYRSLLLGDQVAETFVLEREVVVRGALVDSITGNVVATDELGDVCQVWAVSLAGLTGARATPSLTFGSCGTDGTYEIHGLAPGGYNLFATTRFHASDRALAIHLVPGSDDEFAIRLSPRSKIDGLLVDEQRHTLAGQYIYAKTATGARSRTVVTHSDGTFQLELVPQGELSVVVEGRQVRFPTSWSSSSSSRLEVVVGAGSHVTGHVRAGGNPAAATVSVETARGRYEIATATDGAFSIDDSPGHVVLIARRGIELSPPSELDLGPATSHEVTLELGSGMRIDGRVVGLSGDPMPGMWLRGQCVNAPLVEATTRTSSDGRFRMVLARLDECTAIRFEVTTGARGRAVAELEPGAIDVPRNDATMTATLALRASVLRAHIVDPAGQPIAGATVTVRNATMGIEPRVTATDASGQAMIAALLPGWYSVTASDAAGRQASRDVEMTADHTAELVLQSDASVVVRVPSDETGGKWKVFVAHWPSLNVVNEQELERGAESVLRLTPADYIVMAQRAPVTFFAQSIRVPAGGETAVEISLRNAHRVEVGLKEFWGRPIAASVICRVAPRSMIEAAVPLLFRLRAAPVTSTLQLTVRGDDLRAWCVGNPAMISDGVANVDRSSASVVVVVPDLAREPAYIVRVKTGRHVIERVLRTAGTLRVGDEVLSIDGRSVTGLSELGLSYALLAAPPGVHEVAVVRGGDATTATLCLDECGGSR